MKKSLLSAIAVVSLLFLLWQPKLASYGASQGLILWANVVLPTLLPFMICSNAIVALGGIPLLIWPFAPVLKGLFRLSSNGCYVLISGMLCGYPLGAKTCSDFLNEDMISPKEAACLLAVCNHPSPMFLLGYVMTSIREQVPAVFLLTALYLPILPLWFLSRFCYRQLDDGIPGNPLQKDRGRYFDENLMTSCEVMVKIGGYIMLFSVLAAYIHLLPLENPVIRPLLLGIIEITTGISAITGQLTGQPMLLSVAAVTAFGGLSGLFQTKSVIKNAGLSIRHYVLWKMAHAAISCMLLFILLNFR